MKTRVSLILIICITISSSCFAQISNETKGEAAFLFTYFPVEGMQAQFNKGYKEHLQWHRENNDPLVWYGWYVMTGDRLGMFVDGTFGISFEAFDNRVKPVEDRQHFQKHVAPYSKAVNRKVFRLETDLSTTMNLEDWEPSAMVESYSISVIPGKETLFEQTIEELVLQLSEDDTAGSFTIYRQITGGNMPAYLLMVPHNGFSFYDSGKAITTLTHLIENIFGKDQSENLLDQLSMSVKGMDGETWFYRRDLSYFPDR